MKYLFTSESVTEGHPDKICDQVSDAILDALLVEDPNSRVACETSTSTGLVFITGEITTQAQIDYTQVVRDTLRDIGYVDPQLNFSADTCSVMIALNKQSPDISEGVSQSLESRRNVSQDLADSIGAGDQGIMFGYACNETPEYMPFPIAVAHKLAQKLAEVRKDGILDYLRPDGKTQVTIEYDNDIPVRIDTILISTQHSEDVTLSVIQADLLRYVIEPVLERYSLDIDNQTKIVINPSGRFVIGGPHGDAGLTGRKIIVDTYGGYGRHGGGAFSGKDATKVDRSAAYASRYIAKNIVAAGLAEKCEIQLAYGIGMAHPISVAVFTYGTGRLSDEELSLLVRDNFDLRPYSIIDKFQLKELPSQSPQGKFYQKVAAYGHYGRVDLELPWERLDMVIKLREQVESMQNDVVVTQ